MDLAAYDSRSFRQYMSKAEADKAIHTLEGILKGIAIDNTINVMEIEELQKWCDFYRDFENLNPFSELLPMVDLAIQDGILSQDEVDDIFWLCNNLKTSSIYYDMITSDIQRLQGLLHGIISDNNINNDEIVGLKSWLDENEHLAGSYPYDEVYSLLLGVLADGRIDEKERAMLKAFFAEFININKSFNINPAEITAIKNELNIGGICATCPDVQVQEKNFCFTGTSSRATREKLRDIIENVGGRFNERLIQGTDYLIVGAAGNPCWAFSCYGRKVEKAMEYRKKGYSINIIHENDFWDALADIG